MDDRFEAPNVGIQHALAVRRQRKVPAPLVVFVGGGSFVRFDDQIQLLELSKQSVQPGGPEPHLAAGPLQDFLHDAVTMPGPIGHRQQDVEDLGF